MLAMQLMLGVTWNSAQGEDRAQMGKPESQGALSIFTVGRGLNAPAGTGIAEFLQAVAAPDEKEYHGGDAEYSATVNVSGTLGRGGKAAGRANSSH
jgi:hypothetical protein